MSSEHPHGAGPLSDPHKASPSSGAAGGAPARACGKTILIGEHAVVYGVPALALGIHRGAEATSSRSLTHTCTLHVPEWDLAVEEGGDEMLARAFTNLLDVTRADLRHDSREFAPLAVRAKADLPPGGGLGCSAAVGVAVARALDPSANATVIERRVMAWESVFHGNPSGIDAAVASHGGAVWFQKGHPLVHLMLRRPLHLCVGHSGISSSTKTMVEAVAKDRERRPEAVEKAWRGIAALTANARLCLEGGDYKALGQLLDLNQMILAGLYLSTPEIEQVCAVAREHGALGAKLTGAGGGGSVIAVATDEAEAARIVVAWKDAGYTGFCTSVFGGRTARQSSAPHALPVQS